MNTKLKKNENASEAYLQAVSGNVRAGEGPSEAAGSTAANRQTSATSQKREGHEESGRASVGVRDRSGHLVSFSKVSFPELLHRAIVLGNTIQAHCSTCNKFTPQVLFLSLIYFFRIAPFALFAFIFNELICYHSLYL